MAEYKVQFEVFEGPLDLLLYLIKKEEVDIYEVHLTKLATQFIAHIDLMREFDLEIAGEFLVMASTLMYIKSRELLPVDQQVVVEGEDDGEDPRWELIRQLVEYKKFKDAAAQLQVLEARQEDVFPRVPGKLAFEPEAPLPRAEVSIFDLVNAVNTVLKRFNQREDLRDIFEDKWTVSEKIEQLMQALRALKKVKETELTGALEGLAREHEQAGRSYRLACVAGSWQFVTQPEYAAWLKALVGHKLRPPRLSQPALETLAIIAYRQPIMRAEIEQVRGVTVDGVMQTLLERGLVEQAGRAEVVGRPMNYGTTPLFLEYFGLRSLEDLPAADELRQIPIQRPEGLATTEPGLATAPPEQLALPAGEAAGETKADPGAAAAPSGEPSGA